MKKVYKAPAVLLQNVCTASLMATSAMSVDDAQEVDNMGVVLGKERDNDNDDAWTNGLW